MKLGWSKSVNGADKGGELRLAIKNVGMVKLLKELLNLIMK